ncbi:MAG: NgoPII family restriction endonuclease [Candidatus Aenigmarchaeota archaeon]|nr:NgoPII family restriction endonuclease [Candidatus Aenigmarchaeota archaeon]
MLRSDTRISEACKTAEDWDKKDVFYIMGTVPKGSDMLKGLFIIHGKCYAANNKTYEDAATPVKRALEDLLEDTEAADTNELGRFNYVDPLKITKLRVRGMWIIAHPKAVFEKFIKIDKSCKFSLFSVITEEKYNSYTKSSIDKLEKCKTIKVENIMITNPNNTMSEIKAKLISCKW